MIVGMIAAVSRNGVIGKNNSIPWNYPEDTRFFKVMTSTTKIPSVVIMGRKTFESVGSIPLPKRRNIVITSKPIDEVETYESVDQAMDKIGREEVDVWFIGGAGIYREGMKYAKVIYLTMIPESVEGNDVSCFPWIDPTQFTVQEYITLHNADGKDTLKVAKYVKAVIP